MIAGAAQAEQEFAPFSVHQHDAADGHQEIDEPSE